MHFGRSASPDPLFVTGGPLPEGAAAILGRRHDGACVFHDRQRCTVHHELGPEALPVACQQFPRLSLRDARGTLITLSHYCPTAAQLLMTGGSLEIVAAPAALSLHGSAEGLDATDALPPLLRRGVLADLEGYTAWERASLDELSSDSADVETALDRIAGATRRLLLWQPGSDSLSSAVARAFSGVVAEGSRSGVREDVRRFQHARAAVPPGLAAPDVGSDGDRAWAAVAPWWPEFDRTARAFVACHLFANWLAYYGTGLVSVVNYLSLCLSVLRVEVARQQQIAPRLPRERKVFEAIRQADLLLVHLADIRSLTAILDRSDASPPAPPDATGA